MSVVRFSTPKPAIEPPGPPASGAAVVLAVIGIGQKSFLQSFSHSADSWYWPHLLHRHSFRTLGLVASVLQWTSTQSFKSSPWKKSPHPRHLFDRLPERSSNRSGAWGPMSVSHHQLFLRLWYLNEWELIGSSKVTARKRTNRGQTDISNASAYWSNPRRS